MTQNLGGFKSTIGHLCVVRDTFDKLITEFEAFNCREFQPMIDGFKASRSNSCKLIAAIEMLEYPDLDPNWVRLGNVIRPWLKPKTGHLGGS